MCTSEGIRPSPSHIAVNAIYLDKIYIIIKLLNGVRYNIRVMTYIIYQ